MRTRSYPALLLPAAVLGVVTGVSAPAAAVPVASADGAAVATAQSSTARPALGPPTQTRPVHVEHPPAQQLPLVTGVRTGRHATFDRFVIDLRGGIPGYDVRYVRRVVQDGSGSTVKLRGEAFLAVRLLDAAAHTEAGAPTVRRGARPGLPALREWRLASDFEGQVLFGLGLTERAGFRVLELRNPNRLVIDVAHPLPAPRSRSAKRIEPAGAGPAALLTEVRTARHATYDRTVFTFRGGSLPGVDARYVRQLHQDGSGRPLPLDGGADLQVSLLHAAAHTEDGRPTWSGPASSRPRLPAIRHVRAAGDFEAVVTFGLGIDEKAGFRVVRLENPTRIAVDVAH